MIAILNSSVIIWTKSHVFDTSKEIELYGIVTPDPEHSLATITSYNWTEPSGLLDIGSDSISGRDSATLTINADTLTPGETYVK